MSPLAALARGCRCAPLQANIRAMALAVRYTEFGDPKQVLKLDELGPLGSVAPSEVSLKMLAAPINPSDFNTVQGIYGITPKLPAIAGNEGVGVVTSVGAQVKDLKAGDWVIPADPASGFGTWRAEVITPADNLLKIPSDIPAPYAASIAVNPCTAYRMLRDFITLKPGDVIIQNGSTSMVGLAVIQMAREMGVTTINVIREDRAYFIETVDMLKKLGGDIVIPDTLLNTAVFKEMLSELPPLKLGLNCVAGEQSLEMARALADGGVIVTYGGMSKQGVIVPYEALAYKDLTLKGFWITKWAQTHSKDERSAMIADIAAMIKSDKLTFFYEMFDFDDFEWALQKSLEDYRLRKVILNMAYPDRLAEERSDEMLDILDGSR